MNKPKVNKSEGSERIEDVISRIQRKYTTHMLEGDYYELSKLRETTGVEPEIPREDLVQEAYQRYVQEQKGFLTDYRGSIFDLIHLVKFTGIKPPEEVVQEAYRICMQAVIFDGFVELRDITGIQLLEDTAKEAYEGYIKRGHIKTARELKETTGIELEIPEEVAQEAYIACIQQAVNRNTLTDRNFAKSLEKLIESIGIKPSERVIQEAYIKMLELGQFDDQWLKFTGIEPSEDTLKKGYQKCKEYPRSFWKIEEDTSEEVLNTLKKHVEDTLKRFRENEMSAQRQIS